MLMFKHILCEILVNQSHICVVYVNYSWNDADLLTKPIGNDILKRILDRAGLHYPPDEEC